MRRRVFPNLIGDVSQMEERQERIERVMQMLGITPEFPFTMNVNDGTRNTVQIGLVDGVYGIKIVDNAGNEVILANGTIKANAINTVTLDCSLITVTNLDAGAITAGTISASIISGGTLNASLMTVQNLNAAAITIGTFSNPNDRFTDEAISGVKLTQNTIYGNRIVANSINADRIQAGTITADRIVAKTITADRIQDNSLSTGQMVYNGVNADRLVDVSITNAKISNISADKLTAGTFYVGYSGRPVAMYIAHGSSGDAKFWFEGGSRMWSDSSNRIGINSLGSPMYIYVDSSERIVIPSGGQVTMRGGVYCDGNLNVINEARMQSTVTIDNNWISMNGHTVRTDVEVSFYNHDNGAYLMFNAWGRYLQIGSGSSFNVNGNWKSAIVPTKKDGYRALYCMESPEIWFMDFTGEDKKLAPMFEEVTEGQCKWIKTEDGYQVWRRRKGANDIRFEQKTEEQFLQNERFLSIPHAKD